MSALALAMAFGLLACGQPATGRPIGSPTPAFSQIPSPASSPSTSPTPIPQPSHVFVIVMENRSYGQAIAGRYTAALAAAYGVATNYHGISHPSLPNYLAMTSGSTWGISDDGFHGLPATGLGVQLTNAGISWRAYMEGMTRTCFDSPYPYALKHNPFAYYGSKCPAQEVPLTHFASDMAGAMPRLVWITPGLCNDGHDCSTATADRWLSQTVPVILASPAWKQNGLLIITWDEGEDSANSVMTLVIHPNPLVHRSSHAYNHYSLLATIEERLGLPRLRAAATASPMEDLLGYAPLPAPTPSPRTVSFQ